VTGSNYNLLSSDASHEAVFNTKARDILKSMLEGYDSSVTGIGEMETLKLDPKYTRFNSTELENIYDTVLHDKQDTVRQATPTV
jgi:hypothetical protein